MNPEEALVALNAGECEERLRFETLLTDLSARFINLPADQVDAEIEHAQRRVCESLGVDLSSLWQWSATDPSYFTVTHLHSPPEGPERPVGIDAEESFPWVFERVLKGETLVLSTEEMPPEAALDRESRRFFGVTSSVVIPLSAGGGPLIGVLTFEMVGRERVWPPNVVKRLTLVAEIFANALVRRTAELALRESEERLSLAADSAGAGLWSLDLHTEGYWLTPKTRQLFGFPASDCITLDRVLESVHREDQEMVRRAMQSALASKQETKVEYRIVRPGGDMRWMISRGRVQCNADGEPERLMGVTIDVTVRKQGEIELEKALEEVRRLRDRLQNENQYLREQIRSKGSRGRIVGECDSVAAMMKLAHKVATTDAAVLITGETGTGKELLAQAIHDLSGRRDRPMVKVNCAALPAQLIESELFGREKGAYTGALTRHTGRFELADGSTLFLDEISDLPLELQAKLLRVLQEGEFERLGSHRTLKVDVRIIAATNHDLNAMVREGRFRSDLFFRLNVFPIRVPPLRERGDDIPLLIWQFARHFAEKMGKPIESIPARTIEQLKQYHWPGNVRELRNLIERAVILSEGRVLSIPVPRPGVDVPDDGQSPRDGATLKDVERKHILAIVERAHWRISGKHGAAEQLGLNPSTLQSKMRKLGIYRPRHESV